MVRGGVPVYDAWGDSPSALPVTDHPAHPRSGRSRWRAASGATLLVLLLASAGVSWVTRAAVHGQEDRLLKERANEVGLELTSSISGVQSSLSALGAVAKATPGSAAFDSEAATEAAASTRPLTYALLRPSAAGFVVVAAQGGALTPGQLVSGPRAATLRQAMATPRMVATPVIGPRRLLGFALGAPAAPTGAVVYREAALGRVSAPAAANTAPFAELNVVLYATSRVDSSQLLVTTTNRIPLRGAVRYLPLAAGGSHWLLGVSPRRPLVGTVAAFAPWLALAVGILGSLLIASVVESEGRRRAAALALYATEHQVAETLQRRLLPALPTLPGLDIAARYVAGAADQQVGGDWFDAFPVGNGRVGVVIGDVIGHDLLAATEMSQIRAALRAFAWQGEEPGAVLDRLDELVTRFAMTQLVTVFYGTLDPPDSDGSRMLRFANAGHPPPLLQSPDGRVRQLGGALSVVIGGLAATARTQATEQLEAGSMLLLYTDGLVEQPGAGLDDGLDDLAATFGRVGRAEAGAVCDHLLNAVTGQLRDDIAVLAVRLMSDGKARLTPDGPRRERSQESLT